VGCTGTDSRREIGRHDKGEGVRHGRGKRGRKKGSFRLCWNLRGREKRARWVLNIDYGKTKPTNKLKQTSDTEGKGNKVTFTVQ